MKRSLLFFAMLLMAGSAVLKAQTNVVDEIVAVVGDEPILKSTIEKEYQRMKYAGQKFEGEEAKCMILENVMLQDLMVTQAKLDSITVSDEQVLSKVDRQINYYISQIGSKEKVEEYFNQSLVSIKEELMDNFRNEMLTEQMKQTITKDVRVTPTQVRNFYTNLSKDSLPEIKTTYEVQEIYMKPTVSRDEVERVKTLLRSYQDRVKEGDEFSTLAILYSEDPGSSQNGGELGFRGRGELVPEFANVAFNLKKPGDVSKVVESEFGFHIMQLVERRGDRVNVRHILVKPKVASEERDQAIQKMDSVADLIRKDSISFEVAAYQYSDAKETKMNAGLLSNPASGSSQFEIAQLNPDVAKAVEDLQPGEISKAFKMTTNKGHDVYSIVKLKSKTEGHTANLDKDYQTIKEMYTIQRKNQVLAEWIQKRQRETYISIDSKWKHCRFEQLRNDI